MSWIVILTIFLAGASVGAFIGAVIMAALSMSAIADGQAAAIADAEAERSKGGTPRIFG